MHRRFVFVFLVALLFASIFPVSFFVPTVEAQGEGWLSGWRYRKSHVVNLASGAGTNYQVGIKAQWDVATEENLVPFGEIVSTLPVPSGTSIGSAQAAVYWDGTYLHVWYAATTGGGINDSIYYTKASSPFASWSTPVQVIDRTDGIRDPTIFIEGDYIYLFCQCYDGSNFRPIRLYKVSTTADFTNSNNYVYVGVVIDLGGSGAYDDGMVASPCVVKINSAYYLMCEAIGGGGFSIGRAKSTSIESLPWTKDGQLRDTNGDVIHNPTDNSRAIVPGTFADQNTLFIHYYDGSYWHVRYINGDFPNNSVTLSGSNIDPDDGTPDHNNIAHIGMINGSYFFTMQNDAGLQLYKATTDVSLEQHSRTDFGDVRFTRSDGVTLLPYWIEKKVDAEYVTFWVEVADDLSTNPATICMYYGNSNATTTSNIKATSLWNHGDYFNDNARDTQVWDKLIVGTGSPNEVNQRLETYDPAGDDFAGYVSGSSHSGYNFELQVLVHNTALAGMEVYIHTTKVTAKNPYFYNDWYRILFNWQTGFFAQKRVNGIISTLYSGDLVSTEQRVKIRVKDSVVELYEGDTLRASDAYALGSRNIYIIVCGRGATGAVGTDWFDNVWVRKYVDPEPSHGAWGSEEIAEPPVASFTYSPANPKTGEPILFNASLSTSTGGTLVNYEWNFGDGNVTPTSNPTIIHAYNISGTYNTTLTILDSEGLSASTWNIVIISSRNQTMISISTFASSKLVGFNIEINGTLADAEGNGLSGAIVVLSHTFPGISEWIPLTSATTDTLGNYNFIWIPPLTGQFTIRTEWAGNDMYAPASNSSTLNVIASEDGYVFSVASNSTVSALAFNSTDLQLGFTVTGPSGTTGFARVTIAKMLATNITDLKVYLDGNSLEFSTSSTDDSWIVDFNYTHSTHHVTIALNSTLGDTAMTPLTMVVLILLAVLGVVGTNALAIRKLKPRFHIMRKSSNDKD
jgi:hypothetical protein